jgi:hypothetical protein
VSRVWGLLRPGSRRRVVLAAAAFGICTCPKGSNADAVASWLGGSGNWSNAADWSTNPNYPNNGTPAGTNYQASISLPGSAAYTVTVNSNIAIDDLAIGSSNATTDDIAGTLTVGGLSINSGVFELAGGTLSGGTTGATVIGTGVSRLVETSNGVGGPCRCR